MQLSSKNYCIRGQDKKAKTNKSQKIYKSKNQKSPFLARKRVKLAGFGNISLNV